MRKPIFYLHGLGSGPKANTAVALADYFDVLPIAYTPHDFELAMPLLLKSVPEGSVVVGTSMGGYFALKLAERINKLKVLAINPVIPAREGLARFKDTGFEDFVTGGMRPLGNLNAFEDLAPSQYRITNVDVHLAVGMLDDVVPPQMVLDFAEQHRLPVEKIVSMGHRVNDQIPEIVKLIRRLV